MNWPGFCVKMVQMKKCPGTAAVCRPGQAHFVRTLIYQFLEGMKKMKKVLSVLLAAVLVFALAGCGGDSQDASSAGGNSEMTTITVAASPTPHAEILNAVKDQLAEEGIDLQVEEYTDYVMPNNVVEDGTVDANYFQHQSYLDDFNEENGTHLVSVAKIHYEPMGIYAGKDKSATLENIAEGAVIAVPNDTTNEARALQLLAAQGLIELPEDAGLTATPKDITSNPHNIEFTEVEAAAVPSMLSDVDFAVINGNYALSAGLTEDDSLAFEAADSLGAQTYPNVLVVKEGNENNEAVQKLVKALTSEECRAFIEETYKGMVVPVF